jgi:potassium-transporting ATPase KdpC subunit
MLRRQTLAAVRMLVVMTVLTGVLYPLAVTGIALGVFPGEARGSIVTGDDGTAVGSALLGQAFTGAAYFHPRPSAVGYDTAGSGGSNLGPTNPELIDAVAERVVDYRAGNGLAETATIPIDAVTTSASGLDPHISVANARLQAPRVAEARGLVLDEVLALVDLHTEAPLLGFLTDPVVNVLMLNLDLDRR